jgi:hypothetical protein
VYARTVEPEAHRLPRQIYLWSSSFLQSCYYFDPLLRSPFKAPMRRRMRRQPAAAIQAARTTGPATASFARGPMFAAAAPGVALPAFAGVRVTETRRAGNEAGEIAGSSDRGPNGEGELQRGDRRLVREPYRQAFGRARTARFGRPAGWILLMSAVEKIFFPTALLIMLILRMWEALAVTVAAETAICLTALALVMKGRRLEYVFKGLAATPIRYALLGTELITIGRFASDLWITNNRSWRK